MKKRNVLIVGGGVAGLAAGIYARRAGLEATILEQHTLPGGLCTAWKRKGYTIDGCVHFVVGAGRGTSLHDMWRELGIFDELDPEKDFFYHKDFFHYRFADGTGFRMPGDLDELERILTGVSPEDASHIRKFTRAVRSLSGFTPPLDILKGPANLFRAARQSLPYLFPLLRWMNTSIESFASGFRSVKLREAFKRLWYPEYNMLYILLLFDWMRRGVAGYPDCNSLGFSRLLEKKFTDLGGEIRYSFRVKGIVMDGKTARGVELENGDILDGDAVILAAASPWTVKKLLPGDRYREPGCTVTPPLVHVTLGTSYDFTGYQSSACGLQLEMDPPVKICDRDHDFLLAHIYSFAPRLSPEGRCQVKVIFPSDYSWWVELRRKGREYYDTEKEKISGLILSALERYFPGFGTTVDMIDIATPLTFYRYTDNQEGSIIAWGAEPGTPMMLPKRIPGVNNLVLAGHWVMPGGGVPQAALSGRHAIQEVLRG
jgi:phytoene dehydrogenase-like protein